MPTDEQGNQIKIDIRLGEDFSPSRLVHLMESIMDDAGIPAPLRNADVRESVDFSEAVLDTDKRTVEVTLIKSGWSKNGRYYGDDVLRSSAGLWEGVKAYADHPSKSQMKDRPERSVLDAAGLYENVRYENGKVRATLRMVGRTGDDLWPWVVESVNGSAKPMGLSINALGQARKGKAEGRDGVVVEAITHAHSVDIVTEPAAGGSFDRLLASDNGWTAAVMENMTIEELREARPDLLDSLKREWKTTRDIEAIKEARAEAEQAKQDAARLTEENRTAKEALAEALDTVAALRKEQLVDRLLEDKKLPIEVRKELREKLLKADGATAMQEVIETAASVLGAVRLPVRVTGAGVSGGERQNTTAKNTTRKPTNSLAEAFGVDPRLAEAETLDQYLAIKDSLVNKE